MIDNDDYPCKKVIAYKEIHSKAYDFNYSV